MTVAIHKNHRTYRTLRTTLFLTALQRTQVIFEISLSFAVANAIVPSVHAYVRSYPWNDGIAVVCFILSSVAIYFAWCVFVWSANLLQEKLDRDFDEKNEIAHTSVHRPLMCVRV